MSEFKPTVMPKDESLHEQTAHGGAPGLARPANPEQIDAFSKVSDVNAQDLNAQLRAQDAAKKNPHAGHGLQKFDNDVPLEPHRDATDLNDQVHAQYGRKF